MAANEKPQFKLLPESMTWVRGECESCRYWEETIQQFGDCHRNPPVVPNHLSSLMGWPSVRKDNWCGEFKPKPEKGDQ